jgi:hypothetical protein
MYRLKLFIILLVLFTCGVAADTTLVHYYITGINAGPPTKTLTVYQDGTAELIIDSFFTKDTLSASLDSAELNDLTSLFSQNNWGSLDSTYIIGCLSCPEFKIEYDNKRVRGNTPSGNSDLNAILTGLNDLVIKLQTPTGITVTYGKYKINNNSSSLFPYLFVNFPGRITQYGFLNPVNNEYRLYDLKGKYLGLFYPGN